MRKSLFTYCIILITGILSACSSSEEKSEEKQPDLVLEEQGNYGDIDSQREGLIEQWISETDLNLDKLNIANSLYYTKDDGSSIEANAYLNDAGQILKIEEIYLDSKSGNHGKNLFYLKEGKKYASKELFEDHGSPDIMYVERVSYYDENEKPIKTKKRKTKYEEDLHAVAFEKAPIRDCSMKRVKDVLNQTGQFQTTFQGFVNSGPMSFLIVGENAKNGYVSTLAIQYADYTIKKLNQKEYDMLGKPLRVEFEKMVDESGFEFQALITVKIL